MLYRTGGHAWGRRECNGDKKHCCFYWELNKELNLGLNKDNASLELLNVVSQILELHFHSFSFFLRLRFPHVPLFDITQVICKSNSMGKVYRLKSIDYNVKPCVCGFILVMRIQPGII